MNALVLKRLKLLQEIQYCESRIAEIRNNDRRVPSDNDGSDSDSDTPIQFDEGPSALQLKREQQHLRNCLSATQELCDVRVVESQVEVVAGEPVFEDEPPVTEPGVWREVTAECSVDHLVPFVISFCTHHPNRKFAQTSYRGLRVKILKSKHALELEKSVLPGLTRPSDAIDVIRSYAAAVRSRRDTLARLYDRFCNELVMDAKPEGGFVIKCANLLEISWTLQNRWSPIAPFHHRMKFDVEYMDEEYIKAITQAHRQLSEPDVDTDERTLLLERIISTCLLARGPTQELHESLSSDPEGPSHLGDLRTTLDEEPDVPGTQRKARDSNVMAPPKTVPKKTKPKQKANTAVNGVEKGVKRSLQDGGESGAKKTKTAEKNVKGNDTMEKRKEDTQEIAKMIEKIEKTQENAKMSEKSVKNPSTDNVASDKVAGDRKKSVTSTKNKKHDGNIANPDSNERVSETKNLVAKNSNKDNALTTNKTTGNNKDMNMQKSEKITNKKNNVENSDVRAKQSGSVATNKNSAPKVASKESGTQSSVASKNNGKDAKTKVIQHGKVAKKVLNTSAIAKVAKVVKKVVPETAQVTNLATKTRTVDTATKKVEVSAKKVVNTTFTTEKSSVATEIELPIISPILRSAASVPGKNPKIVKKPASDSVQNKKTITNPNKPLGKPITNPNKPITNPNKAKIGITKPKHTVATKNLPLKTLNKPKTGSPKVGKISKAGNIEKENNRQSKVVSKIPQKSLKSIREAVLNKNPLRISPTKSKWKPSSSTQSSTGAKIVKPVSTTNIPRLAVKPRPKVA